MTAVPAERPRVPLLALTGVFFKVGITSFGGSTAAWCHREVVQKRGWLDEEGFLTALMLAQVLPGANPVNMSIYVGSMLRGGIGGAAAAAGMIGPPFCVILLLGFAYARYGSDPIAHTVLAGLAAVGVGMTLMIGVKLTKSVRTLLQAGIAAAIFAAVGLLHWPTIPVVLLASPISIGIQVLAQRRAA